jgi:hypothetical protein
MQSQAGLRAREPGILPEDGTFPCDAHSGLTPSEKLAYRCVGSAGMIIPLECFTGFPFHPAAARKLRRDT